MAEIDSLKEIVEKLRSENGCPWDRAQTHEAWAKIKKEEKAGKEWYEDYLPAAFKEATQLIKKAEERKGYTE